MSEKEKSSRVCSSGHKYFKTSDCPVCPVCESHKKPAAAFFSMLVAPAQRALENAGINSLEKLSKYSESEILELHGLGRSSLPKLRTALQERGMKFKQ